MKKLQFWNAQCQVKSAVIEEKAGKKEGIVEAYVSIFDTEDSGGDIVKRGAFARSIAAKSGKFPVLSNHDWKSQIGWGIAAVEDSIGLRTTSWYDLENNAKAREHFSLIQKAIEIEAQAGFSFGYMPVKWEIDREKMVRTLTEVKLYEWSPVTFPMHEGTFAVGAKNFLPEIESIEDGVELLLETLKEKGYSQEQITTALQSRLAGPAKDPVSDDHSLAKQIQDLNNLLRVNA